jgi:predicted MFS family arabinose efflux permease
MVGNLAVSTGETGPFLAVEQVLVARAIPSAALTMQMSLYTLVGYGAAGLGAFTVTLLDRTRSGAGLADLLPTLAWLFAVSGVAQAVVYTRLEPTPGRARADRRAPVVARSPVGGHAAGPLVRRLAALFSLDSLAGGFALQSLIAYWLQTRFGLSPAALGRVFLATQALTAGSLLVAARVAPRFGLVNTMVFSHLASNVLLIAMALAPDAGLAVALLLARALLSQIDVPTRQAFLMGVVPDGEREAAATLTNASRTVAQAVSPSLTGYVMQAAGLSAPFILGGALKIVYDCLLYATCRRTVIRDDR